MCKDKILTTKQLNEKAREKTNKECVGSVDLEMVYDGIERE